MRAALLCIPMIALVLFASGAQSMRRTIGPPSSLEPSVKKRSVRVSHRHQRIRSCVALGEAPGFITCSPRLEDADSATTVTFNPTNATVSSASERRAVVLQFGTQVGRQDRSVELALGSWSIDWPGARAAKHLDISIKSAPTVALRTLSGRCDRTRTGCAVTAGTVSQRITVTETQQ